MLPLALSGKIVIAVAVTGALLLLLILLRSEDRYEQHQRRDEEP